MSAVKRAKEKEPRHVRLYHWLLDSEAWCDLDPVAHSVYLMLARRYGGPGSNNGRIPCSLLELAQGLHISKQTAMRALDRLQDHGFIVQTRIGSFNTKVRHATEWCLTEFKNDVTGEMPTKAFMRWRKSEHGSTSKPQRVSRRNRTGFEKEQVTKENRPYGSTTKPVAGNHGSTSKPLVVYQGETVAAGAAPVVPFRSERRREAAHTSSASSLSGTALSNHKPPQPGLSDEALTAVLGRTRLQAMGGEDA